MPTLPQEHPAVAAVRQSGTGKIKVAVSDIDGILRAERATLIQVFAVAFLVMLFSSLYLAGTIAEPVKRLAAAADRVMSTRSPSPGCTAPPSSASRACPARCRWWPTHTVMGRWTMLSHVSIWPFNRVRILAAVHGSGSTATVICQTRNWPQWRLCWPGRVTQSNGRSLEHTHTLERPWPKYQRTAGRAGACPLARRYFAGPPQARRADV